MGVGLVNAYQMTLKFNLVTATTDTDIAEFTIWGQNGAGTNLSEADAAFLAQNAADSWSSQVGHGGFCSNVQLQSAIVRCFNTSGHTTVEQEKTPAGSWYGTSTDKALPWETSLCISEYGYRPGNFAANARRLRGRYYLPPMSVAILNSDNTGTVDPTQLAEILADQKRFYNGLFDGSGTSLIVSPVIFSRGAKSGGTLLPPELNAVQYLAVDAVIDSQRRRRNKQKYTKSFVAF